MSNDKKQLIEEIRNGKRDLCEANLGWADLRGADLREADLREAYLLQANLSKANLREADLREADVRRADLRGADLRSANLSSADLRGADLRSANLRGANLCGADLCGANLSGANLTNTTLPNGQIYEEYLKTLPELFTATGRKFEEIVTKEHWDYHSWSNCPMAAVFDVYSLQDVPAIWQEKAQDFITYFDANMLPFETVIKLSGANLTRTTK